MLPRYHRANIRTRITDEIYEVTDFDGTVRIATFDGGQIPLDVDVDIRFLPERDQWRIEYFKEAFRLLTAGYSGNSQWVHSFGAGGVISNGVILAPIVDDINAIRNDVDGVIVNPALGHAYYAGGGYAYGGMKVSNDGAHLAVVGVWIDWTTYYPANVISAYDVVVFDIISGVRSNPVPLLLPSMGFPGAGNDYAGDAAVPRWHPSDAWLAVWRQDSAIGVKPELLVAEFVGGTWNRTIVRDYSAEDTYWRIESLVWSPSGGHLIVGMNTYPTYPEWVRAYPFNAAAGTLGSAIASPASPATGNEPVPRAMVFRPQGDVLATLVRLNAPNLFLHDWADAWGIQHPLLDAADCVAYVGDQGDRALAWSDDGVFLAALGQTEFVVYQYVNNATVLAVTARETVNAAFTYVESWTGAVTARALLITPRMGDGYQYIVISHDFAQSNLDGLESEPGGPAMIADFLANGGGYNLECWRLNADGTVMGPIPFRGTFEGAPGPFGPIASAGGTLEFVTT